MTNIEIRKNHCMSSQTSGAIARALCQHATEMTPGSFLAISDDVHSGHATGSRIEYWHIHGEKTLYILSLKSFTETAAATVARATVGLLQDAHWIGLRAAIDDQDGGSVRHKSVCLAFPDGILMVPKVVMGLNPDDWGRSDFNLEEISPRKFWACCNPGLSNHAELKLQGQMQFFLDRVWDRAKTYVKMNTGTALLKQAPVLTMAKDTF